MSLLFEEESVSSKSRKLDVSVLFNQKQGIVQRAIKLNVRLRVAVEQSLSVLDNC